MVVKKIQLCSVIITILFHILVSYLSIVSLVSSSSFNGSWCVIHFQVHFRPFYLLISSFLSWLTFRHFFGCIIFSARFIFVCFIFSFRLFYLIFGCIIFSAVSFLSSGSFSSILSSRFVSFISFSI